MVYNDNRIKVFHLEIRPKCMGKMQRSRGYSSQHNQDASQQQVAPWLCAEKRGKLFTMSLALKSSLQVSLK